MLAAGKLLARSAGGGGGGGVVSLTGGFATSYGTGPRYATVRIANDGKVYTGDQGFFTFSQSWLVTGNPGDFDVRCTVLTGSLYSGTTGSWLDLATTREWTVLDDTDNGDGLITSITLEIRDGTSLTVLATAVWELQAERFG